MPVDKNEFLGYVAIIGALLLVLVMAGLLGPTLATLWTLASGVVDSLTLPTPEGA